MHDHANPVTYNRNTRKPGPVTTLRQSNNPKPEGIQEYTRGMSAQSLDLLCTERTYNLRSATHKYKPSCIHADLLIKHVTHATRDVLLIPVYLAAESV